jgi:hypothetical protein
MKKMVFRKIILVLALVLGLSLSVQPARIYAAMQPMGFFSGYTYLDQGDSSILDNGNQSVNISASTVAKGTVESLGVTVTLQKYTGSVWIDVGSATTMSKSNDYYFSNTVTKATVSGYYYRAHTVHWVSNRGLYEQADRYTSYILAK